MKNLILISLIFFTSCNLKLKKIDKNSDKSRDERVSDYKKTMDSINQSLEWKATTFGLWKSKNGDLGLKTVEATDTKEGILIDKYIMHLADERPLSAVIDTATFQELGAMFYKGKNHIYTHYTMSDGGFFWIVEEADVKTFKVIGNCYAKDKNHIFGERKMILDSVDYNTFITCDDCVCWAKDKNGYYSWGDKTVINDIEDKETLKIIEILKKL